MSWIFHLTAMILLWSSNSCRITGNVSLNTSHVKYIETLHLAHSVLLNWSKVQGAIGLDGATHLSCFRHYLVYFYAKIGFGPAVYITQKTKTLPMNHSKFMLSVFTRCGLADVEMSTGFWWLSATLFFDSCVFIGKVCWIICIISWYTFVIWPNAILYIFIYY